ncbi:GntR family transcriptional regulator [Rhizobium sp. PAMB 3174]
MRAALTKRDPGNMNSEFLRLGFSKGQIDDHLPKTVQVYELLRGAIITMKLLPGEAIIEKEICEALGISRTPLREAIIRLAAESLVIVRPSGGTFVNHIIVNEVLDGQITRDTLERRLVKLAARHFRAAMAGPFEIALFQQKVAADEKDMDEFFRLDNSFHQLICECSGFPNGWRTLHSVTGQLDRVRRYALTQAEHCYQSLAEHHAIYQFIKNNDEDAAADAFRNHVDRLFSEVDLISHLNPEMVTLASRVTIADIR